MTVERQEHLAMTADDDEARHKGEVGGGSTDQESLAKHLALAQRSFALRDYAQAIESYASALENLARQYGDASPESADVLVSYGKALLEYAISQSGVLGKTGDGGGGETATATAKATAKVEDLPPHQGETNEPPSTKDPRYVFADEVSETDAALDGDGAGEDEGEGDVEEEEEEEEAEDDFATAWQVLDLARVIYEKKVGHDARKKLGDVHVILGDVSLETENFSQAMADYRTALEILGSVLPASSGQLAEAHYKLGLVLEYDTTAGARAECVAEMRRAIECLRLRVDEVSSGSGSADAVGKAKDKDKLDERPLGEATQKEVGEIEEMIKEIEMKIEDVQANPVSSSAPSGLDQALDQALKGAVARLGGQAGSSAEGTSTAMAAASTASLPVNDLTSLVKKRKKGESRGEALDVEVKRPKAEDG